MSDLITHSSEPGLFLVNQNLNGNMLINVTDTPGYVCFRNNRLLGRDGEYLSLKKNKFKEIEQNTPLACLALIVLVLFGLVAKGIIGFGYLE